jgi:hypothetical protein
LSYGPHGEEKASLMAWFRVSSTTLGVDEIIQSSSPSLARERVARTHGVAPKLLAVTRTQARPPTSPAARVALLVVAVLVIGWAVLAFSGIWDDSAECRKRQATVASYNAARGLSDQIPWPDCEVTSNR